MSARILQINIYLQAISNSLEMDKADRDDYSNNNAIIRLKFFTMPNKVCKTLLD